MSLQLLCKSKDGYKVFYDAIHSHAATHFDDTPGLKVLVSEVLEDRNIAENKLGFDLNMKRVIGTCDVVEANDSDEIIYALRKNRAEQGHVPFTKSRKPESSTFISIALVPSEEETYILSSAWIGTWDDPPFPQQPHATPESKPYWSCHAFVWGSQEIEPNSAIESCPW